MGTPARPVIFLHIGAMKTGTTYLQALLSANRDQLAAAGFCFPGRRWADQEKATRDVLGHHGGDPVIRAACDGMWTRLSAQMLAHDGRASIFSMEFLSFATRRQAAAVVASLADAEVHVVLTVRDALGAVPAQWQTRSRNRGTVSWPAYARSARRVLRLGRLARGDGARMFRAGQGIPRMLRAWAPAVPPGRLHVVTVPPPGSPRSLLWERFASVVGVDPKVCTESPERTNPSLGQPSAELLRRINLELGTVPISDYQPTLRAELANSVLAARSGTEPGARLDRRTWQFALDWNRRVRRAIRRSGAEVVGDLNDLPVRAGRASVGYVDRLGDPAEDDVMLAAAAARDGLLALVARRRRQVRRRGGRSERSPVGGGLPDGGPTMITGGPETAAPTVPQRWSAAPDPVSAAVAELTALAREAIELRRQAASRERQAERSPR